jgi:hypothetical protein
LWLAQVVHSISYCSTRCLHLYAQGEHCHTRWSCTKYPCSYPCLSEDAQDGCSPARHGGLPEASMTFRALHGIFMSARLHNRSLPERSALAMQVNVVARIFLFRCRRSLESMRCGATRPADAARLSAQPLKRYNPTEVFNCRQYVCLRETHFVAQKNCLPSDGIPSASIVLVSPL